MEDLPPLSVDEAEEILFRINGAGGQATLVVGGQALAFWAEQLFGGLPPLSGTPGPIASKDIDVMGGRRVLDDIDVLRALHGIDDDELVREGVRIDRSVRLRRQRRRVARWR